MRKAVFFLLLQSLVAASAVAQITVGVMPPVLNSSDANLPTPQTDISLENPATATGSMETVTFGWNATCTGVAKIKFFRRSGNTLTLITERGPFNTIAGSGVQSAALSPVVPVQAGDLIGITRVVSCGNALAEHLTGTQGYVAVAGDVTSATVVPGGNVVMDKLAVMATGSAAPAVAVQGLIPVVGSTAGGFGSNFKTSVQLLNPTNSAVTGRFIFHRSGSSGSLNDPSQTFSAAPGEVVAFGDLVAAMAQAGLGSMDVVMSNSAPVPIVITRIYNDQGTNGTSGAFEDLITTGTSGVGTRILTPETVGYLLTPIEPARTRMNIGVRSLAGGATLNATLEDGAGHTLAGVQKVYVSDYFEQVDSMSFFGVPIGANQKIRLALTKGSAIVYGATTDNVTNDPSVVFATAVSP